MKGCTLPFPQDIYIYIYIYIYIQEIYIYIIIALNKGRPVGDTEYTDCFSAEEYDAPNECPEMTLNNLIMRLQ